MLMRKSIKFILIYTLVVFIAFTAIAPSVWIFGSSLNPGKSIFSTSLIPKEPTLSHYKELFTETDYKIWFLNTLKVAIMNMIASLILTTTMAYSFSRFNFKGKNKVMIGILVLQMFPNMLALVAIYVLITKLGLLNSHLGLVIVYATGQIPFNTWLVKGYLDGIPKSLDEAARIDGASNLTIFTKVILPLAKPIMVFVALTNFIGPWFDFIFPQLILRKADKFTLAMGLFRWVQARAETNFTLFAAGAVLVAVPITLLWGYFQKDIVEGLSAGATKG